ncbi:hypothetical protein [Sinorhizobium meliloti]|nr:hypothetical protein [Sinorhizobium meliloti]
MGQTRWAGRAAIGLRRALPSRALDGAVAARLWETSLGSTDVIE